MENTESIDAFCDYFYKVAHGETFTERLQRSEAKTQQLKAENQQNELNYIKAFFESGFSIQKIADLTKLSVAEGKITKKIKVIYE